MIHRELKRKHVTLSILWDEYNAKTAVIKACLYEPSVNRTYTEMAAHYDTAILPTRPRRPRDKAKVEAGVLIMERWILGRLRNRRFDNLAELNEAIRDPQAFSQARDSPYDRLAISTVLEVLDEAAVDLDPVEWEAAQVAEAGTAGAEIVHRDAHAERTKASEHRQRVIVVLQKHSLRNLELEPIRPQSRSRERRFHGGDQVTAAELSG